MMPNSLVAVAVLAVALTPGYVYHRCYQRYAVRDDRGVTAELIELFLAGALSSAVASVLVLIMGEAWPAALARLPDLVNGGAFLRAHPWQTVRTAGLSLLLSVFLAIGAGWLAGRFARSDRLRLRQGNVWVRAFTRRHAGRRPYLAVELDDGRLVEGYLLYCSTDADPQRRDLALQAPLAGTEPDGEQRIRLPAASVVIPGAQVRLVHISYPAERPKRDSNGEVASAVVDAVHLAQVLRRDSDAGGGGFYS